MKRLVAVLVITIVILGVVSGFLVYQNIEMQNQNSELRNQNSEIEIQLDEQQIQNSELENQINNLQNQSSELEVQILELENRVNELENPVYDIDITSFSVDETWDNPVGVTLVFDAYITIKNKGNTDVAGLVVFVKRIGDVNYLLGDGYTLISPLKTGEEREIHVDIWTSISSAWKLKPIIHTATLRLGTIIVDEYTLS
jgi:uncharacterized protein YxeA